MLAFARAAAALPASRFSTLVLDLVDRLPPPSRDVANALAALEPDDASPPSAAIVTAVERCRADANEGLLEGAPTVVKDTVDIAGLPTRFGRPSAVTQLAGADAAIIGRLLRHGARIVGKTELTELAVGGLGIDRRRGAPRNPAAPSYLTGGSSSGTASAVADGTARFGIGGDGLGSIRIPAGCCGLVGLKPTYGVLPTAGYHSVGPSLDTLGPIARDVDDCTRLWLAMRYDRNEAALRDARRPIEPRPPRSVGIISSLNHEHACDSVAQAVETVLEALAAERVRLEVPGSERATMLGASIGALELRRRCPALETDTPEVAIAHMLGRHMGPRATSIHLARMELQHTVDAALERCEVIVMPTTALPAPPRRREWLRGGTSIALLLSIARFTPLANCCGLPSIAVPVGVDERGRPLSMMFVGRRGSEIRLFEIAKAIEDIQR
ncbi:MAG: amidase [Myxococcales bacterium]|nr:amidase [Myxococcales bacterium]